ncbi:MAG: hypothetical protein E6G79_06195 [Alphaproteobacteria bacterium]|jgi:hypothetical protein|nr:MAG: hypothetical protein E6G79_06195 [Alphaproteobacteria bacterium]
MWDKVSRADLEEAKQRLNVRREQTLRRHTEELRALDGECAEVEELERLIGAVFAKFEILTGSPPASHDKDQVNGTDVGQPNSVTGVSFLITQAQKLQLRELGVRDEEIRNMKPAEAHRILGLAS